MKGREDAVDTNRFAQKEQPFTAILVRCSVAKPDHVASPFASPIFSGVQILDNLAWQ